MQRAKQKLKKYKQKVDTVLSSSSRSRRGWVSKNQIAVATAARLFFLTAVAISIATRPFKFREMSVSISTRSFVFSIHSLDEEAHCFFPESYNLFVCLSSCDFLHLKIFFLSILMVIISLELTRVNPD